MLEQREIGVAYQKWVIKLIGFDFTIVSSLGSKYIVVNALSRRGPDSMTLCTTISSVSLDWDVLVTRLKWIPIYLKYRQTLQQEWRRPWA